MPKLTMVDMDMVGMVDTEVMVDMVAMEAMVDTAVMEDTMVVTMVKDLLKLNQKLMLTMADMEDTEDMEVM